MSRHLLLALALLGLAAHVAGLCAAPPANCQIPTKDKCKCAMCNKNYRRSMDWKQCIACAPVENATGFKRNTCQVSGCVLGYRPRGMTCVQCTAENVVRFKLNSCLIAECELMYRKNGLETACVACAPIRYCEVWKKNVCECKTCTKPRVGEKCQGLQPGLCDKIENCRTLDSSCKCSQCNPGFIHNEERTACDVCTDPAPETAVDGTCKIYSTTGQCNCALCKPGFDGPKCAQCANVAQCSAYDTRCKCSTCKAHYKLQPVPAAGTSGDCVACQKTPYCQARVTNMCECTTCAPGSILTPNVRDPADLEHNFCKLCMLPGPTHKSCKKFVLGAGTLGPCTCAIPQEGWQYFAATGNVTECGNHAGCAVYTNPGECPCSKAKPGYILNALGIVEPCFNAAGCQMYNQTVGAGNCDCVEAKPGYILHGNDTIFECFNLGTCKTFNTSVNATACDCDVAKPGYYLDGETIKNCTNAEHCRTFSETEVCKCIEGKPGWTLNVTNNNEVIPCANTAQCKGYNNATGQSCNCDEPQPGFFIDPSDTLLPCPDTYRCQSFSTVAGASCNCTKAKPSWTVVNYAVEPCPTVKDNSCQNFTTNSTEDSCTCLKGTPGHKANGTTIVQHCPAGKCLTYANECDCLTCAPGMTPAPACNVTCPAVPIGCVTYNVSCICGACLPNYQFNSTGDCAE